SWLGTTIAAYRMDFENKVITEGGINRNAGNSYHRGIEAEIELGVWNGLSMFLNGTIQKATFSSGENDGNILPNAPQRLAAAGIRYKVLFGDQSLIFNVSHNYVGKQYTDAKNTAIESEDGKVGPVPSYHVDRKSTRLNSSHVKISYAVFCLKK